MFGWLKRLIGGADTPSEPPASWTIPDRRLEPTLAEPWKTQGGVSREEIAAMELGDQIEARRRKREEEDRRRRQREDDDWATSPANPISPTYPSYAPADYTPSSTYSSSGGHSSSHCSSSSSSSSYDSGSSYSGSSYSSCDSGSSSSSSFD